MSVSLKVGSKTLTELRSVAKEVVPKLEGAEEAFVRLGVIDRFRAWVKHVRAVRSLSSTELSAEQKKEHAKAMAPHLHQRLGAELAHGVDLERLIEITGEISAPVYTAFPMLAKGLKEDMVAAAMAKRRCSYKELRPEERAAFAKLVVSGDAAKEFDRRVIETVGVNLAGVDVKHRPKAVRAILLAKAGKPREAQQAYNDLPWIDPRARLEIAKKVLKPGPQLESAVVAAAAREGLADYNGLTDDDKKLIPSKQFNLKMREWVKARPEWSADVVKVLVLARSGKGEECLEALMALQESAEFAEVVNLARQHLGERHIPKEFPNALSMAKSDAEFIQAAMDDFRCGWDELQPHERLAYKSGESAFNQAIEKVILERTVDVPLPQDARAHKEALRALLYAAQGSWDACQVHLDIVKGLDEAGSVEFETAIRGKYANQFSK